MGALMVELGTVCRCLISLDQLLCTSSGVSSPTTLFIRLALLLDCLDPRMDVGFVPSFLRSPDQVVVLHKVRSVQLSQDLLSRIIYYAYALDSFSLGRFGSISSSLILSDGE